MSLSSPSDSSLPSSGARVARRPVLCPHLPDATLIRAVNVRKHYQVGQQEVKVLRGISLTVVAGEMVAIMGPSGAGKSTLMHCLAGLEPLTSGEVILVGRSVPYLCAEQLARLRRTCVGFVFQQYNLMPMLNVFENVALPYRLQGVAPPVDAISSALEELGVGHLASMRPPTLSGGEQQRVAVARVLAQQPQVVFADEPTGALDTHSGQQVLAALKDIAGQPDQCVVIVTHDPAVAAHCDRVLFLRDGRLVRELTTASPEQVAAVLAGLEDVEMRPG